MKRTPEKPDEKVMKLERKWIVNFSVYCLAFSPDGNSLVVAGETDLVPKVWNLLNGLVEQEFQASTTPIHAIIYTPDGKSIIAGYDYKIKIFDLSSEEEEPKTTLIGHTDHINALVISEDGKILYSGSGDSNINVWDLLEKTCIRTLTGHVHNVNSLAITPGFIISGSADGTVKCWNRTTGECNPTINDHKGTVTVVASHTKPDGSFLFASGSIDTTIKFYDDSLSPRPQTLQGHTDSIMSLTFNVDGSHLASGSFDNTVKIWDVSSGTCLQIFSKIYTNKVHVLASSRDGLRLVSGSRDGMICVWIKYSYV